MIHKHHLLYPRKAWESHESTKVLRRDSGLIIPMHDEEHHRLHSALAIVPILDRFTAWRVAKHYESGSDSLSSINNFLISLDLSLKDNKTDRIARANGAVVMQSIGVQLDFIHRGIQE